MSPIARGASLIPGFGGSRFVRFGFWGVVLVFGAIFFTFPQPAHAQFTSGFDPAGQVQSFATTNQWLSKAQGWARTIYVSLLIFEIIALGITTLLFRENLGEFFASVALKIVLGSVFFWFISVAGPGLTQLPGQVMETFGNTFGKGMGGTNDVNGLAADGVGASALFFGASYAMRQEDGYLASLSEPLLPNPLNCTIIVVAGEGGGDCYRQPSETIEFARQAAELLTSGLGVMVGMAVAAVYLQFTLITIESWLVMTAGTLFIGFAGSRFTMPFSQGYFTYMVSVGVKLMALYLALGIVGPLMTTILESSIASLVGSLLDPTGFVALASAVFGALAVVVGSGIIAMVPGFAASFLTGTSSASGASTLAQAANTIAGSAQMMSQLSSANHSRREAAREQANAREVAGAAAMYRAGHVGANGHQPGETFSASGKPLSGAAESQANVLNDTLGVNRPAASMAGGGENRLINASTSVPLPGATASSSSEPNMVQVGPPSGQRRSDTNIDASRVDYMSQDSGSQGFVDPRTGQQLAPGLGGGGGLSLVGVTPAQLDSMSREEALARLQNSDWSELPVATKEWYLAHQLGDDAVAGYQEKFDRELVQAQLAEAYALSGLSQTGIRDIGQPTAVQVRISSPDKL